MNWSGAKALDSAILIETGLINAGLDQDIQIELDVTGMKAESVSFTFSFLGL